MLFHYQVHEYYLYSGTVDMRKGIDSLVGIVNNELGKDPLTGDLFIFINKRRRQIKMLHWQGDGFAVFYKRLEKGTYELAKNETNKNNIVIDAQTLQFILCGIKLSSVKKHKRYTHQTVSN
jgi:transposase